MFLLFEEASYVQWLVACPSTLGLHRGLTPQPLRLCLMNMALRACSDLVAVTGGPHHAMGEQWACLILGAKPLFIQHSRP